MVQNLLQKHKSYQTNSSCLLSNPSICRLAPDCWLWSDYAASMSIKVWLDYLLPAAVGTNCSLPVNPSSRCHMADSSWTELKPRGASRSAGGRSKNKTFAFSVRCRGRWGFPHHLRWLKMQPLPVVRRRVYLGGCLLYFSLWNVSSILHGTCWTPASPLWPLENNTALLKSKGTRGK